MAAWYYSGQGSKHGPVSEQDFGALLRQGTIDNATLVWRSGLRDWMPLSRALLEPEDAPTPLPFHDPGTQPPARPVVASFGARFLAKLIDAVILSVPTSLMVFVNVTAIANAARNPNGTSTLPVVIGVNLLLLAAMYWYEVLVVASSGGTFGKRLLKLRIIKEDGQPLNHGAALGRFFAQGASSMFFGFGYWMALFDPEKRAMHDHICRTRVVREA